MTFPSCLSTDHSALLLLDKPFGIRELVIRHFFMHRSITFWSGLLVIAFLGWAWWDSERMHSEARSELFTVGNIWGGLMIARHRPDPFGGGGSSDSAFVRYPFSEFKHTPETFPAPCLLWTEDMDGFAMNDLLWRDPDANLTNREFLELRAYNLVTIGVLFIPHWLLILLFMLSWTALLLWRARRRKKRMTNAEFPNAE